MCKQCLPEHKTCSETPILDQLIYNVKTCEAFESVHSNMDMMCQVLSNIVQDREENLSELQKLGQTMSRQVEDKVDCLIKHLTQVKQNTLSDIHHIITENKEIVVATIQLLQQKEKFLRDTLDQRDVVVRQASNFQIFMGIKEMELAVDETNTLLREISDNKSLDNINISLEENKEIENKILELQSLGKLIVSKSPTNFSIETSDIENAIAFVRTNPHLKFRNKFELEKGVYWGCSILPTGLMVITDNDNDKTMILTKDGSIRSTIHHERGPWGVTVVGENQVAVSHPDTKTISIIDINQDKVVRTLYTKEKPWGITYIDDQILYCVPWFGITRLTMETGTEDRVISDEGVWDWSGITANSSRVCYTCPVYSDIVKVLDSKFNLIFKFNDKSLLTIPTGITIDEHMNVFVVGGNSHNLMVFSPEGKTCKHLLGPTDGLCRPSALNYDQNTQVMVIVNRHDGGVFRYSVW